MIRLKGVGMNCGVEYTSLPFFSALPKSSRYDHSVGVALLSYRYSQDRKAALAGLFHDIASPCFAHTIDFLKGDHAKQEKTEEGTCSIIRDSETIRVGLAKEGIALEEVADYSRYSVCDNPSPKLSSDRLEYTLRNIYLFGYANLDKILRFCSDLALLPNEFGEMELQFEDLEIAAEFANLAYKTFGVYICKEDRFAMEELAKTIRRAIEAGLLKEGDLHSTEKTLINKLTSSLEGKALWNHYRDLKAVDVSPKGFPILSKVRYIDPFVQGKGRLSKLDPSYGEKIDSLLSTDFSVCLEGRYE